MSFSFVFPLVGGSGGGGTVSSVGLSMPTDDFNIANSPVTGSDTIAVTYKNQIQNLIFGSPDGITGTPLFRYLVGTDLPSATTSVKGALPIATDAEALAGSITDKIIVPETLSYTFLNRQIGAITAINSAILATDTINGAFAKAQGQINAKQNTLTVGDITGSEFSITGGVGAVIGTGVSLSLAVSGVSANTYGSSTVVPVVTVNSKGIITGVTTASIAFPPSSVTSVFGRSGAVTAQSGDYTFAQISSTPTTLAGYGITDAVTTGGSASVSDISITGLAGSGFLNLRYQSSVPVGLANYGTLYADSIGNIGYKKNANAFTNSLYFSGTADRVYTLQDRSGTLVDDTDLALKAPIASPTFTGTVTTPDVILSGATASTPTFFDSAKKLITTTAQLWGTWVQTWSSKATPVDADTIGFHDSATTFVGVKSTLLNFWTTYLLPKVQALGYLSAYTIPNYYKVNYTTGSDITGVAGRTDKPFATLQAVWDLIPTSNTTSILIEIEGEYTFTTHAVYTTIVKNNVTFTFLNDIIYNVNSTATSRPLFTFSNSCSNLTFNCPTFTMTKQGGFLVMTAGGSANINFNTVNALMGIDAGTNTNSNWNLVRSVTSGVFNCNNLNISVTNDSNAIKGNAFFFSSNTNLIYNIGIVTYSGAPTVASTGINMFFGAHGIINIKKFISNITTYTNIAAFGFDYTMSCSIVNIDEVTIASSTGIKTYAFLNPATATMQYNIKKLSLLNSQTLITGSSILNFGYFEYNGYLSYGGTFNGTLNFEYIKCTATATEGAYLSLKSNTKINGIGRGVWEYTPTTYLSNTMALLVTFSGCNARISNVTFYGSGMQTADVNSFVPIRFNTGTKFRLDNVIFTTNLDTNSHANTTPIRAQAENAAYTCTIEGNFSTNYLLNVTGLTNNCEVDLISGYIV
jgi:hypothetical protein